MLINDNLSCFQHIYLYFICGIYFDDSDYKYRDKIRRGVMKIIVIIEVIIIFIWVGIKINRKCNKNNVVQKHRRNSSWTAKLFDLSASLVALHLFFVSFKPFFYRSHKFFFLPRTHYFQRTMLDKNSKGLVRSQMYGLPDSLQALHSWTYVRNIWICFIGFSFSFPIFFFGFSSLIHSSPSYVLPPF